MVHVTGHSPHGECGLKSTGWRMSLAPSWSLPAWGVRVEISPIPTTGVK